MFAKSVKKNRPDMPKNIGQNENSQTACKSNANQVICALCFSAAQQG
jgi:hypothetical protein